MNAVQILTSARDRLARNRRNWITGTLVAQRTDADEGKCFCSIGAVLNEGGAFSKDDMYTTVPNKLLGDMGYSLDDEYRALCGLADALTSGNEATGPLHAAKAYLALVKDKLEEQGFSAKPTLTALAYLQAASKQVANVHVIGLNDAADTDENYQRVLTMFNVAIKNAKRRHRNGKRIADKAVSL